MRRREGSRYGPLNAVEWTHRSTGLKNDSLSQFISEQKILKDFTTFIKAINHRFKIIKLKSSEKDPRRVLVWSRNGLLRKILRSWLSLERLKPGIHAPIGALCWLPTVLVKLLWNYYVRARRFCWGDVGDQNEQNQHPPSQHILF